MNVNGLFLISSLIVEEIVLDNDQGVHASLAFWLDGEQFLAAYRLKYFCNLFYVIY